MLEVLSDRSNGAGAEIEVNYVPLIEWTPNPRLVYESFSSYLERPDVKDDLRILYAMCV